LGGRIFSAQKKREPASKEGPFERGKTSSKKKQTEAVIMKKKRHAAPKGTRQQRCTQAEKFKLENSEEFGKKAGF